MYSTHLHKLRNDKSDTFIQLNRMRMTSRCLHFLIGGKVELTRVQSFSRWNREWACSLYFMMTGLPLDDLFYFVGQQMQMSVV